jgi:hypothetical protein
VDPDSVTLWIRIRIGNPDPDPGQEKYEISVESALFSYFKNDFPPKKKKIALFFEINFDE